MRYPWQLLNRLAERFELYQVDEAHADLDCLLDVIAQGSRLIDLRKLRCAQVISFCMRGALAANAPSSELLSDHIRTLSHLARLSTWLAARTLMHGYLDGLFAMIRAERRTDVQRLVQQIRKDLRHNLESPRTLRQYAEISGLSVAHLSRSFTVVVGLPFRKELRRVRLAEARRLLATTLLKINVVARRVGLRDPSQFIAAFRRDVGVTPNQFRHRIARRTSLAALPKISARHPTVQ